MKTEITHITARQIFLPILVSACIALYSSCNVINPDEEIPSYIRIDSISLTTNVADEGSNSHKIVDAWIYIDNNPVGVYQLPCNIPVLETGSHVIDIKPGVLQNGISATHLAYPFYQFISRTEELKAGESVTISNCSTSYFESDTFPVLENFDNGITFFNDTNLLITNAANEVFEGTGSAKVKLANGQLSFEIKSIPVELPSDGSPVYLEMNYKNDIPFTVGLQIEDFFGTKVDYSIIKLNSRGDWNKIYIELAPTINSTTSGYKYSLIFGTQRTETPEAYIYFDNIKVVHY